MMAGGGAAAAAAIAEAIKASGAIVRVEPNTFATLVSKSESPLVILAERRFGRARYRYLTGYKGLVFFTKSPEPLPLPGTAEIIAAKKIWIPG
jgi:hypothetical protein